MSRLPFQDRQFAMQSLQRWKRIASLMISIAYRLLRIAGLYTRLGVSVAILFLLTSIRPLLARLAIMSAALCAYFEFVARIPSFPFWSVMTLPIACTILRTVIYVLDDTGTKS
jgi:uncharacterized protein YjeT (DUF2065 family)